MSSEIKEICNSVLREQVQSIRDLTSGHLNENHLYHPRPTINGKRKPTWSSSQKPHPTLRPAHRLTTYSTQVEEMKDSLVDFTYSTLPDLRQRKARTSSKTDSTVESPRLTDELLPPIRMQVPSFSIDLSDEQRMRKIRLFNGDVLKKSDVNLHGLGPSEDFVALVEENLLLVGFDDEDVRRRTFSVLEIRDDRK